MSERSAGDDRLTASGREPIRVMLVSPRPPPPGGIASWTEAVRKHVDPTKAILDVFDTAPRVPGDRPSTSRFRLDRAVDAIALLVAFGRRMRVLRPRVVHVNTSYHWALPRDALFVWLARRSGARTVLHLHGGDFDRYVMSLPRVMRPLVWGVLRRADRVVVITEAMERFVASQIEASSVARLPNFIPRASRGVSGTGERSRSVELVALFVGALIEAKGVRTLLHAARGVLGLRIQLVGPPDPSFLASLATEREALGERLAVCGACSAEEVDRALARADLFVLPSRREGFPIALLEAMATGLPVIATPVGAVSEIVRDGVDGRIVPVDDEPALARALAELAHDESLRVRLGAAGRARVNSEYSAGAVVPRLVALWTELAATAGRAT